VLMCGTCFHQIKVYDDVVPIQEDVIDLTADCPNNVIDLTAVSDMLV